MTEYFKVIGLVAGMTIFYGLINMYVLSPLGVEYGNTGHTSLLLGILTIIAVRVKY